jgi:predicted NBD/HSP70 family sugar kinase
MTYATPDDVALDLRGSASVTSAEDAQWQAWLDRVERAIQRAFTRAGYVLDDQVVLDAPREVDVIDVEVAAVVRKIQNPNPAQTSMTRTIDDAQITTRNESGVTANPLDLTDAELAALLPSGRQRAQVFSVLPS